MAAKATRGVADTITERLTCALMPGACAARAVESVERTANATRTLANERAQLARTEAAAASSGFFSGITDVIDASAEPVESTASALRYQAVTAAIITVAIVVAIVVIAVRTL